MTLKVSRMVPFWGSMVQWRSQLLGSVVNGAFGTTLVTVVMMVLLEVGWLVMTEFGWLLAGLLLTAGDVMAGGATVAAPWLLTVASGFSVGDVSLDGAVPIEYVE